MKKEGCLIKPPCPSNGIISHQTWRLWLDFPRLKVWNVEFYIFIRSVSLRWRFSMAMLKETSTRYKRLCHCCRFKYGEIGRAAVAKVNCQTLKSHQTKNKSCIENMFVLDELECVCKEGQRADQCGKPTKDVKIWLGGSAQRPPRRKYLAAPA